MNYPSLMSIESITFRCVKQTINNIHGYYNSLTISNNSWIMKETFFLMATFRMSTVPLQSRRPLDRAVLWASCLGEESPLGIFLKVTGFWANCLCGDIIEIHFLGKLISYFLEGHN